MENQGKELRAIRDLLEEVRGQIDRALGRFGRAPEQIRSLGWRCTGCGYTKHFTRLMPIDVAPPYPKCHGKSFQPC